VGGIGTFKTAPLLALLFLAGLPYPGFEVEGSSALPLSAPGAAPVSILQRLWPYGVPKVLKWSRFGIAVGTSAGYLLAFSESGELKWSRKVNFTSVWSVAWSESGELAVATLGPPGALYVFNAEGELLWSREWEGSQVYLVEWSGELLAVAAGEGLMVFNGKGELAWSSPGSALTLSWRNGWIAAGKTVIVESEGRVVSTYWALQVFDGSGGLLWSRGGVYHHLAWSGDGYLAAADRYGGRVCVFDSAGALVWERSVGMEEIGALAWFGELLVVGGSGGVLAFDKSGRTVWSYEGYFVEALSARGGSLAVGDYTGNLTLLDASGRRLWSYWTCGYVWAIDWYGDRIAAASSDGYVQVLDGEGGLSWRRKVGFNVEAVAVGELVAAGGWDLSTYVFNLNGSLKWSRETGWVKHLAWHGDYLAVGGYERTFVLRSDGSLVWEFDTGKVRSLSWSDDGLLAVGCTDRFGVNRLAVFGLDGQLLWSAVVPDWVLSVSWSGDLLAAAVAGHWVYVSDRSGRLKFAFKSIYENATIPWRVAASWWGDRLVVVTDRVYMLDRDGELLWVNEFASADTLAPGGDFVALGSSRGVSVLDIDGELEWSYLTPEYVAPKEPFTKLYPQHVNSLAWVGGYLVAGDHLGRVFVFNETGDVIQVFEMGDAVWSVSAGSKDVFAAGGGGGLLIAVARPVERPQERILTQLPPPYDRFEVAIANKTLLHFNGTLPLKPSQPLTFQFEVSESAPYAFLEANLTSTPPVKLTLQTRETGGGATALSRAGTSIRVKAPLEPGKYLLEISAEEETQVNCTLHAYEGFLPFFEERRVYLPMGLADYGYADLPEGRIGYRYTFTEAWGFATISSIAAARSFGEDGEKHWVTLQLNAFLHAITGRGKHVYWVQSVVVFDTLKMQVRFASSIWNATAYPTSTLAKWAVEGRGFISRERRTGDYYVYNSSWASYGEAGYPLELALHLSVQVENGTVKLSFGRSMSGEGYETYDMVVMRIEADAAYFKVDPTDLPQPSNLELVFAGPHGGKPKTALKVEAKLRLLVKVDGDLIPAPTAYSCGYATHERVANASVRYLGDYTAAVEPGRARMQQVYHSAGALTPLRVVAVRDLLKLYSKLLILKAGEALPLTPGYAVDLGNGTRYLLKGYTTRENEVTLEWAKQYYLKVVSDYGGAEGEGWYDEGSTAVVSVVPEAIDFGNWTRVVFKGWAGDISSATATVVVTVDAPKKVKALWSCQYYLSVSSKYGSVSGSGWYDKGNYARVELSERETGFLIRQIFERWIGLKPEDRVLAPGAVEVYVDGPRKLEAVWKTDYTQLITVIAAVGAALAIAAYHRYAKRRK
jgi:WD40 repeat protein